MLDKSHESWLRSKECLDPPLIRTDSDRSRLQIKFLQFFFICIKWRETYILSIYFYIIYSSVHSSTLNCLTRYCYQSYRVFSYIWHWYIILKITFIDLFRYISSVSVRCVCMYRVYIIVKSRCIEHVYVSTYSRMLALTCSHINSEGVNVSDVKVFLM